MREFPMPAAQRDSLVRAACSKLRLDGRRELDYRNIRVYFPAGGRGCCQVRMGRTLVVTSVTCEVAEPRSQRPSEGVFHLNLELSPMASAGLEGGRMDRSGAAIQALLEHCVRDSRCLDLESLCIVAGEKVFVVRANVAVLNHEGNLLDCAVLATVAALAHARRPDVSVSGQTVRVHPASERPPVPLSLRHFPLTLSFALFAAGRVLLLDPSRPEEAVMEGLVVVAMNVHRELCGLQTVGGMLLRPPTVLRCVRAARRRIRGLTFVLQRALANAEAGVHLHADPELAFDLAAAADELRARKRLQRREEAGLSEGELSDAEAEETPDAAMDVKEEEPGDIYASAVVRWDAPGAVEGLEAVEAPAAMETEAAPPEADGGRRKRRRRARAVRETAGGPAGEQAAVEEEEVRLECL